MAQRRSAERIAITRIAAREFRVEVRDGARRTTHAVSVPERLRDDFEVSEDDLERVVRESFRFLLEREPSSAILSRFSLSDITRYFPEYSRELPRRLS